MTIPGTHAMFAQTPWWVLPLSGSTWTPINTEPILANLSTLAQSLLNWILKVLFYDKIMSRPMRLTFHTQSNYFYKLAMTKFSLKSISVN